MDAYCPCCEKEISWHDLSLYRTERSENEVEDEHLCECPECGFRFGVIIHYVCETIEFTGEWE